MTLAERLARRLHGSQTDRQGRPYVEHLEAVVAGCLSEDADIAWLHDTLEDTDVREDDLAMVGIDPEVIAAVVVLAKMKSEAYADYISRVIASGNPAVLRVKASDLRHNLRPGFPAKHATYRVALARIMERLETL